MLRMELRIGISLALAVCAMITGSAASAIAKPAFVSSGMLLKPPSCLGKNTCGIASLQMKTTTKTKKKGASSGGFGKAPGGFGKAKAAGTETVDAALLLRQSMDLYDKLGQEVYASDDDDTEAFQIFKEYVVSVRAKPDTASGVSGQLADWVPAACLAIEWTGPDTTDNPILKGMSDPTLAIPAAVKQLRREVWECACQSAPNLCKFPRSSVEYAVEPLDNFGAILEEVKEHKAGRSQALATLGLTKTSTPADIKSAHRKSIVKFHPDKTADLPEEERLVADTKFKQVQAAYEALGGPGDRSKGGSWYESLGGKARSDFFSGAISLDKISAGALEYWTVAAAPIEQEITIDFLMRNAMR